MSFTLLFKFQITVGTPVVGRLFCSKKFAGRENLLTFKRVEITARSKKEQGSQGQGQQCDNSIATALPLYYGTGAVVFIRSVRYTQFPK